MNFDGMTELTERGIFDRRKMKADEGEIFSASLLSMLFLDARSFQPRSGCKNTSPLSIHGRIYCTKPLQVGVGGAKVDFFQARRTNAASGKKEP
jgi:hypothetical protein